jgi:hypothetical protein
MLLNEFKLSTILIVSKSRQRIANFLIWIVSKLDTTIFEKCLIGEKVELNTRHYVPQDGEWHHFAYTVDMWMKFDEVIKNPKIYVDGKKAKKLRRKK